MTLDWESEACRAKDGDPVGRRAGGVGPLKEPAFPSWPFREIETAAPRDRRR